MMGSLFNFMKFGVRWGGVVRFPGKEQTESLVVNN